MSLKERFQALPPGRKRMVVWLLATSFILVLVIIGYNATRSGREPRPAATDKAREISLEPDLIEKTMLREQRREIEALKGEVAAFKQEQGQPEPDASVSTAEQSEAALPEIPTADQVAQGAGRRFPPAPFTATGSTTYPPPASAPPPPREREVIGGIGRLSNKETVVKGAPAGDKKKEQRTVYLPPSFMEARLLTGFDASTAGDGKNNPEPLLLRIQAPAVLPNDVKANLRGCFVIAEAVGRLNKERADVRLVSLSCLGIDGEAVIDTTVKGFITDSDSKVGLAGRVVSKMGAATARAVVAGIFGGAGNALQASAMSQSTSPLGTTTLVDTNQLGKSAVGGGLTEGAKSLHDLYLDLAKQATPVIEVVAAKKVTVVISEGKELEIKEFKGEAL